jgi:tetratricopeptide (TPR) repeat protein
LRAALDWAAECDPVLGLELACAYENFWGPHAPAEGVRRVEDLLASADGVAPRLEARALRTIAGAAHQERDFDLAERCYEESLRIFTELGDLRGATSNRMRLAYCALSRGHWDLAPALLDQSLRDSNGRFPLIESQGVLLLAHLALVEDRLDDANVALDRSGELAAAHGWRWYEAVGHTLRLVVALRRGDLDEAERRGRAALSINVEENHAAPSMINSIAGLARVAFARDELVRAGLLWGAVLANAEQRLGIHASRWRDELRDEARPAFLDAVARGRTLELRDAAAIALGRDARAEGAL